MSAVFLLLFWEDAPVISKTVRQVVVQPKSGGTHRASFTHCSEQPLQMDGEMDLSHYRHIFKSPVYGYNCTTKGTHFLSYFIFKGRKKESYS